MNADDLITRLEQLNLSVAEMAWLINADRLLAVRWATGSKAIPRYVELITLYWRSFPEALAMARALAEARQPRGGSGDETTSGSLRKKRISGQLVNPGLPPTPPDQRCERERRDDREHRGDHPPRVVVMIPIAAAVLTHREPGFSARGPSDLHEALSDAERAASEGASKFLGFRLREVLSAEGGRMDQKTEQVRSLNQHA